MGGAFGVCKATHRIWLRILSIALEKGIKLLDYAKWVPYYYLVFFDCFPSFLHFPTSLIKLLLWLKFLHRQRQTEVMRNKNQRALLCFSSIHCARKWTEIEWPGKYEFSLGKIPQPSPHVPPELGEQRNSSKFGTLLAVPNVNPDATSSRPRKWLEKQNRDPLPNSCITICIQCALWETNLCPSKSHQDTDDNACYKWPGLLVTTELRSQLLAA